MNTTPLAAQHGNNKLIYGSELLLILFATFLLLAAVPPKTIDTNAVPVKVNLPAIDQNITEETQTTAFLALDALPQTNSLPLASGSN